MLWLDAYVMNVYRQLDSFGKIPAKVRQKFNLGAPIGAARFHISFTLDNPESVVNLAEHRSWGESAVMLASAAAPFILEGAEKLLSIQVSPELAEDFQGAEAPAGLDYAGMARAWDAVYIDLPPETFAHDEGWHIRALFLLPQRSHVSLVVAIPKNGRLNLDHQVEAIFTFDEPLDKLKVHSWTPADVAEGKPPDPSMDAVVLKEKVENLAKLVLLYYLSGEGQRSGVPHVTPEQLERLGSEKKRSAKLKQFSMFKAQRLTSPPGRFGRTDQEAVPAGGWQMKTRTTVRGHFRWQAHGPGWKQHRLKWIAPFERGPKDAPMKHELHTLHGKERRHDEA